MRKTVVFGLILIAICAQIASGQTPKTLKEGKALSAETGKPLLLEFVRED